MTQASARTAELKAAVLRCDLRSRVLRRGAEVVGAISDPSPRQDTPCTDQIRTPTGVLAELLLLVAFLTLI